MAPPLQSKFVTNKKLRDCAVRDADHIGQFTFPPGDRSGSHVGMIHEALNKWLINSGNGDLLVTGSEFSTSTYGPMTAKAIRKYKTDHNILNYKNEIDEIVGIKTVHALDLELPPNGAPPPPDPRKDVIIVAFDEAEPMLMARRDHDPTKGDLNDTPSTPSFPPTAAGKIGAADLAFQRRLPTFQLEANMLQELAVAGKAGAIMGSTFIHNGVAKDEKLFGFGSPLGDLVAGSAEFKAANEKIRADIKTALTENILRENVLDYHVLKEANHTVDPPSISFHSRQLKISIGSAQGIRVLLEDFSADKAARKYAATVIYFIFDHFGADDSDLVPDTSLHGSPGQVALRQLSPWSADR